MTSTLMDSDAFKELTKDDMKAELSKHKLKVGGNKPDLVARYLEWYNSQDGITPVTTGAGPSTAGRSTSRTPTAGPSTAGLSTAGNPSDVDGFEIDREGEKVVSERTPAAIETLLVCYDIQMATTPYVDEKIRLIVCSSLLGSCQQGRNSPDAGAPLDCPKAARLCCYPRLH